MGAACATRRANFQNAVEVVDPAIVSELLQTPVIQTMFSMYLLTWSYFSEGKPKRTTGTQTEH
jgi:hypothetical protein